jgi:hypothetical protein
VAAEVERRPGKRNGPAQAADAVFAFQDENVEARGREAVRGGEARRPRAYHDYALSLGQGSTFPRSFPPQGVALKT